MQSKLVVFPGIRFCLAALSTMVLFASFLTPTAVNAQRDESSRVRTSSKQVAISTTVVINEIFGGAGCGTAGCATYQNDYVELKNISAGPVNVTGWSVQYKSATGITTTYAVTPLSGIIKAGDTFLVVEGGGNPGTGVNATPTANATGSILMAAGAGKVALVNTTTPLDATVCPPTAAASTVIDLVGYGATASCFEGAAAAAAPSTTTSVNRSAAGADTDQNGADFTAAAPTPQTAATPTASSVSISGRVMTADGRGITNAKVRVSGNLMAEPITVLTSRRGTYFFDGLVGGETYVITVMSRRFTFDEASRIITLNDNATGEDFVAEDQ